MSYNGGVAATRGDVRRRGKRRGRKRSFLSRFFVFLGWLFVLLSVGFFVCMGFWIWAKNRASELMPSVDTKLAAMQTSQSEIISADGQVIYEGSRERRETVPLSEIPQMVRDAMIAAEDRRFEEHHGVDYTAIARVLFLGAKEGRFSQGGSTLTMQLAKRMHSEGERSYQRKLIDMALASEMEDKWSKDHILQLYLNQVYFGSGAYGIQTASEVYFGHPVSKLTLAEAAMLARCVRRPTDENPYSNLTRAIENRNIVLRTMLDDGKISQDQYDKAKAAKVHLVRHGKEVNGIPTDAPYVVEATLAEFHRDHPDLHFSDGGIKIYTTINLSLQHFAERAVEDTVARHRGQGVNTGAFVLMDGQGGVMCDVGGADYKRNAFNVIFQGHRQPGSSFKPFVYATALQEGKLQLDSTISNERLTYVDPSTGRVWRPDNDNGRYGGMVSLRSALANSINVAAARTIIDVGVDNVVRNCHDVFGFKSDLPEYPSLALGACSVAPIEMAEAYSVFMLRGSRPEPYIITKIEDGEGRVIYQASPKIAKNVLAPGVCDDINTLLRAVVTSGTGTRANVVPDARGKTGTTSDNRDAWFCGFANGLVGVGWVGNEKYSKSLKAYVPAPMRSSVFGGTVTIEIWTAVMKEAYAKFGDRYSRSEQLPSSGDATSPKLARADQNVDKAIPVDPNAPPVTTANKPLADGVPPTAPVLSPVSPAPGSTSIANPPDPTLARAPPVIRPRPQRPKPPAEPQYVEVEICADSGELATDYCPEVVTRRFLKGHEPKRHCHLHHG